MCIKVTVAMHVLVEHELWQVHLARQHEGVQLVFWLPADASRACACTLPDRTSQTSSLMALYQAVFVVNQVDYFVLILHHLGI